MLGDKVFPLRKTLIKELSQKFTDDVEQFIAHNFQDTQVTGAFFFLREEIKALQSSAKFLTLNTHAFSTTRNRLSECWDLVKNADREKKQEFAARKAQFKENEEKIAAEIAKVQEMIAQGEITAATLASYIDPLEERIKKEELSKEERALLRSKLHEAEQPILEKIRLEKEERARAGQLLIENFKEKIATLLSISSNIEELTASYQAWQKELNQLSASKSEKLLLEKQLKTINDRVQELKNAALLTLSSDDQTLLHKLKEAISLQEEMKKEVKERLERLKKQKNNSSLSFEAALVLNDTMVEEKERLDKLELSLSELQEKIDAITDHASCC